MNKLRLHSVIQVLITIVTGEIWGAIVISSALHAGPPQPTSERTVTCEGRYKHHLQGVAVTDDSIFWSFTTELVKTDLKGKKLASIPVANHHGDLCVVDGQVHVAVNLGEFNNPAGKADSWVYVYSVDDLKLLAKHATPQVFHGAGGVGHNNERFYVVGGLPDGVSENYVYEYDENYSFVKKHIIDSGHTYLGIQTATFAHDRWWFGCYGTPKILIVTDANFKLVDRLEFDCSLGVDGATDGRLIVANGKCVANSGCDGTIRWMTVE